MILEKDIGKEIHKIEVPYNFRPSYGRGLSVMSMFKEYIKFIYMPCGKEDNSKNTRSYIGGDPGMPQTGEEYLERIKKIQSFDVDVCILFQQGVDLDLFKKYYDLGIRHFILGDDELATKIKEIYPDVELNLTITRHLSFEDICAGDFSMYDEIVLFFGANRRIDLVEKLPKRNKYAIQVNAGCYGDCKGYNYHGFQSPGESTEEMKTLLSGKNALPCRKVVQSDRDTILIYPEDVHFFAPYVDTYKLIDRTMSTELIMEAFLSYVMERSKATSTWGTVDIEYFFKNGSARPKDFYNIEIPMLPTDRYLHRAEDLQLETRLRQKEYDRLREKYGESFRPSIQESPAPRND